MADRDLANLDAELAAKAQVIPGLDVRLAFIDTDAGEDKYHVMQGLRVPDDDNADNAKCCHFYQRSGGTGTRGSMNLDGPMELPKVAKSFADIFLELTGHEWGSVQPGHCALPGKYYLQQQATPDLEAKWQYYVSDGVDGKQTGWYPYEDSASAEVEELYAQHVANSREQRTATRLVHSGYFTYKADLEAMTQTNQRTGKVRTIRRAAGEAEAAEGAGAGRGGRARAAVAMKARRPPPGAKAAAARPMKEPRPVSRSAMKAKARAMKVVQKGMKKAKPMKVMKKAMKVSKVGSRKAVLAGKKERTKTGVKAEGLMKNKANKIVSKRKSAIGKARFEANVGKWIAAFKKAREELGLAGFVAVKKGTPLFDKIKELLPSVEPYKLR